MVATGDGGASRAGPLLAGLGLPEILRLNLKEPQRKAVRYGVLAVAGGLLLFLVLGDIGRQVGPATGIQAPAPLPGGGGQNPAAVLDAPSPGDAVTPMERALAHSLEDTLAQVEGVGRVRVQVALAGALERNYVSDQTMHRTTTQERDPSGGSRVITQEEQSGKVLAVQGGRGQEPVLRQLRRPEVRGVLVVAEGAADPVVEAEIARAVQVAVDVPLHRVVILPGKGSAAADTLERR